MVAAGAHHKTSMRGRFPSLLLASALWMITLTSGLQVGMRSSVRHRSVSMEDMMMNHIYASSKGKEKLNLDDFDNILDALYVYKKQYGDAKIPIKFTIPESAPWPSKLHGLKIGKRLQKLFASDEFNHPRNAEKVDAIKNLGFDPSVSMLADDWDAIIVALRHYKVVYDNVRVTSKFVVPNTEDWPVGTRGLKLGTRVAAIRSAGRYVKDHPERMADLQELGFEFSMRENRVFLQQTIEALQIYKKHVDDSLLDIPSDFIIPETSEWPEALRGENLGQMVSELKKRPPAWDEARETLSNMGFLWKESGRALFAKRRFEMIYRALVTYRELFGNLLIPQVFVVPSQEPWPEESWGLKLGARVNAIRSQGTLVDESPERRELLDALGFSWELPSHLKKEQKRKLSEERAMGTSGEKWAALDGELLNSGDVVLLGGATAREHQKPGPKITPYSLDAFSTAGSTWPYDEQNEGAGGGDDYAGAAATRVGNLRLPGRLAGEKRSILNFDPSRMFEPSAYREVAAEALGLYIRDREYSSDPDVRQWAHFEGHLSPERFHKTISRNFPLEDIEWMKKIGYRILEFGRFLWDDVAEALLAYKKHFGNVDVPHDFVINEEIILLGAGFTERMEDLNLGEAVAGLRNGDIDGLEDPQRRKFLDSLGFAWGDKSKYQRYRFVPMLLGLKLYKHLYGFPLPQYDFVVPEEPQWPYWMAGMPLGEWAAACRVQQKLVEQHYPDRWQMLNALEFLWWIPPVGIHSEKFSKPL